MSYSMFSMSKPTSTISSAVSIRVSNDLLDSIREYAIAHNLINNSGRPDKRGEPNLSQAFSELARLGLGQDITVSDSVSNSANDDLRDTVKNLSDSVSILSDKLGNLETAIAPLLARLKALETNLSTEATAPRKFYSSATSESQGNSAAQTDGSSVEPESLPIIETIATTADPTIEPQSRQNLTELSESEKNNVLDNVLTQIILDENKPKTKVPDETLTVTIANTAAPSIDNPLPDETFTDAIAATAKQKKITYRLNRDGSVILGSIVGTSIKVLKRMSDAELKAIGIFRTLIGANEKFFPIDPDAIAATAKPKSTKKQDDRRFTLQEAVDFYNSAHPSDRPLKANSLKQNAKMYGFMIKERGSGLYALIES